MRIFFQEIGRQQLNFETHLNFIVELRQVAVDQLDRVAFELQIFDLLVDLTQFLVFDALRTDHLSSNSCRKTIFGIELLTPRTEKKILVQ